MHSANFRLLSIPLFNYTQLLFAISQCINNWPQLARALVISCLKGARSSLTEMKVFCYLMLSKHEGICKVFQWYAELVFLFLTLKKDAKLIWHFKPNLLSYFWFHSILYQIHRPKQYISCLNLELEFF